MFAWLWIQQSVTLFGEKIMFIFVLFLIYFMRSYVSFFIYFISLFISHNTSILKTIINCLLYVRQMSLKISKYSQENTCVGVSF